MTDGSTIDAAMLAKLRTIYEDDAEFRQLLEDYFANGTRLVELMRGALAVRDFETLERHAHSLKGTSAMFGAMRAAESCAALEGAAKDGDGDFEGLMAAVAREHDRAELALRGR